jgi:hypothetical protein
VTSVELVLARLRGLVSRLEPGAKDAEFARAVRELIADDPIPAPASIADRILYVLRADACSPELIRIVDDRLRSRQTGYTVWAAARHAGVSMRTLERHWNAICHTHVLGDFFRLLRLAQFVAAPGSLQQRAAFLGVDLRTVRRAARQLTGQPLRKVVRSPEIITEVLKRWVRG